MNVWIKCSKDLMNLIKVKEKNYNNKIMHASERGGTV
jgi:hypothetical protein